MKGKEARSLIFCHYKLVRTPVEAMNMEPHLNRASLMLPKE